jgi:4-hydroxybenzoate polyprenyltransferase
VSLTNNRWWIYQQERFPVLAHGLLFGAFSSSAICYSALRRAGEGPPAWVYAAAWLSVFCFFFQLRVMDEFKDAEDDARFRPYRPVPRGLVRLRELAWLGAAAAAIQLAIALFLSPNMIAILALCWGFMALMGREFFIARWLKAHPVHYLWTHMLVLPLIDLYATACDWLPVGPAPEGLQWLLIVSFANGLVIEIGRKLRAPEDEEAGVETYSALWGRPRAMAVWLAALCLSGLAAWQAARVIHWETPMLVIAGLILSICFVEGFAFLRQPFARRGKRIEILSGIWTLLVYLSMGTVPYLLRRLA